MKMFTDCVGPCETCVHIGQLKAEINNVKIEANTRIMKLVELIADMYYCSIESPLSEEQNEYLIRVMDFYLARKN